MIKKIALFLTLILANLSFAQENTASPYSFYGIGSTKFKGTNDMIGMGGISVYSDSTHFNILNPATSANQMLTTFAIGGNSNFYKLNNSTNTEKAQKTSFDYFILGFPLSKKWGLITGIYPNTSVGYRFLNTVNFNNVREVSSRYKGLGGTNKIFLSSGYKLNKKLNIGLSLDYIFGNIDTETIISSSDVIYGTRELNNSAIKGFAFTTGLTYSDKLNKKINYITSLSFTPKTNLSSDNSRYLSSVTNSNGKIFDINKIEVKVQETDLSVPAKFIIGAGIGNRKWFFGGDYTQTGATNQLNRFDNYANVSFEKGNKIAFGGFFIPKFDSYNNYFARIIYRAGFRFENTGLTINKNEIKDNAFSFGLGLPINGSFSKVNIGVEVGTRGTTNNNLIKENYFSVNIGLILNDKWFRKVLYN